MDRATRVWSTAPESTGRPTRHVRAFVVSDWNAIPIESRWRMALDACRTPRAGIVGTHPLGRVASLGQDAVMARRRPVQVRRLNRAILEGALLRVPTLPKPTFDEP